MEGEGKYKGFSVYLILVLSFETGSLYVALASLGLCIDEAGLKLTEIPASNCQVLQLKT